MKHYGDITKLKGNELPIVDVITGGSPCQDLSVAGKRAGLAGERSGLFMEQIRLVKEMRDESARQIRMRGTDEPVRPRYMVWENVPGAFSSNKGADFQAVLEETAKVAERNASIPGPPGGKWPSAGAIMGNGWSIAWRLHDAQFWGVPQRRKRISLVADFGGATAPEILFERKGVSRDFEESGIQGQEVAASVGNGTQEASSYTLKMRGGREIDSKGHKAGKGPLVQTELSGTLDNNGGNPACNQGGMIVLEGNGSRPSHRGDGYAESDTMYTLNSTEHHAVCIENHPADSRVQIKEDGIVQTLSGRMGTGGGNVPMVMESSAWDGSQVSPTLTANNAGGNQRMPDKDNFNAVVQSLETFHCVSEDEKVQTLKARDYKDPHCVCYGLDRASFNQGANAQYDFRVEEEKIGTQVAKGPGAVCQSIVRRLTPMECERLQGYPDHWTDIGEWVDSKGKVHKDADSPRYKALGNSIALPFWQWMARKMVAYLPEHCTMASLFDGIGGFPLVFSRCGCKPVWASEIEEFPIAVTKMRFPSV